jgi:hypothetical protein
MFGSTNTPPDGGAVVVPTSTFFQLCFVPERAKEE